MVILNIIPIRNINNNFTNKAKNGVLAVVHGRLILLRTSAQCFTDKEYRKFNVITQEQDRPIEQSPRVVIIGAGIAGLSAASRLVNSGFKNVMVLEATERPGGRIYSCWLGNSVAEVGAQWITGGSLSNSVVPLARQEGLFDGKTFEYDYSKGMYMTSNGQPLDPLISSNAYLIFNQLLKQAYALSTIGGRNHGSLFNFFSVRIDQELHNLPAQQRNAAAAIMYGLTNKISNRWGTDLDNMSADLFGSFVPLIGKSIGLPSGYVAILSPLIKSLPGDIVKYQKVVNQIQWKNVQRPKVRMLVRCTDHCEFYADYVIVTVSLGVLKKLGEKLFDPKLPQYKMDAIKSVGFGNTSKIFLEYKSPFWVPEQGPIKFAWSSEEINKKDSWMKGLHCLEELPGYSHVLMGTVSGEYADIVEEQKDVQIAEQITAMLRRFTQNSTIPYPDSVLRSRWGTSPYFFGSTSYMHVDSTKGDHLDLMRSIPDNEGKKSENSLSNIPRLIFAGEAMSKDSFSTVHGARLSGLKAANDIIQLTNKLQGPPPAHANDDDDEDDEC